MMLLRVPLRPPNPEDAEEPHHDAACEGTGMILAAAYTPGDFTACRVDARRSMAGNRIPGLGVPRVQVQVSRGFFFGNRISGVPVSLIRPETGIGDTGTAGRRFRGPVPPELRLPVDLPACRTPTRVANVTSARGYGHVSHSAGQDGPESGTPSYHQSTPARCRRHCRRSRATLRARSRVCP